MRTIRIAAACLAAAWVAGTAFGDEPDPTKILEKVDAATKAANSVSYDAKVWGEGDAKDMTPQIRAKVSAKARPDEQVPFLRVEVKLSGSAADDAHEYLLITDGKMVMHVNKDDNETTIEDIASGLRLLRQPMQLVWMQEFFHPKPFSDELNGDSRKYEGTKKIGDTECHVIHVVYKDAQGESRWYFGKQDNLPHRVDRIFDGGTRVLELTHVNIKPAFDETTFQVKEAHTKKSEEKSDD